MRLFVAGHVQGVFFRASTRDEARRLGLVGWVRNRFDGSVEVEAEGPPAEVDRLVEWCAHGPPGAHVTRVVAEEIEPTCSGGGFHVSPTA